VLARRNARFAVVSNVIAKEISNRADELIRARRSGINNTVGWLIASLLATLAITCCKQCREDSVCVFDHVASLRVWAVMNSW
jgi:hypothetical protein